jgi:TPR repeat protein
LLFTRGDTLLSQGDVAGARLLLEYAANSGNKQAMVRLGNSYDPEHLAKLGVRGVQPDEARAVHWYDRAAKSAPAQ